MTKTPNVKTPPLRVCYFPIMTGVLYIIPYNYVLVYVLVYQSQFNFFFLLLKYTTHKTTHINWVYHKYMVVPLLPSNFLTSENLKNKVITKSRKDPIFSSKVLPLALSLVRGFATATTEPSLL